jgi:CRP-like cAMP-binding protein
LTEKLKYLIRQLVTIDDESLDKVVACFKYKPCKKNSILLSEGEICKEIFYVVKGCVRFYFINNQGNEKTRYLTLDCSIGTAMASFASQQPSFEFIDVLEDTELLVISHADFYTLVDEIPAWQRFYSKILEMAYIYQHNRLEQLATLNARQRYLLLLKTNPYLIQRVTNKILASYLDVTQETLSRLKSK